MLTLSERVRKAMELQVDYYYENDERIYYYTGYSAKDVIKDKTAKYLSDEHARTKDLVAALCECVSALEKLGCDCRELEGHSELCRVQPLTALTAALEKVEGK